MSSYAKILSLAYDSGIATKTVALKSNYRSVRLVKDTDFVNPKKPSYETNVLLNGKCLDPETRNLYVFYIDTFYGSAWIIEINIDSRRQNVVYYDKYNAIGFDPLYKIYNARVVHGRLVWTDNKNPVYQMDIARAKKSFELKIGYGQYPQTLEWDAVSPFGLDQIVSNGNKYYKSLLHQNSGHEPKTDDGTNWLDLKCLVEDAYYSMDVKNFYFEPIPPKMPPEVTYYSDDTRKINNLRQTLFQCAYRYVYMDWRKSTFSPASIVPVPQAEEETATGLANEVVSLNNKLQIVVNSGGEEVRAIEVVTRSSADPAHWFLVDTINKFEEQERSGEISRTAEPENTGIAITLPLPTVSNVTPIIPDETSIVIAIHQPYVMRSEVTPSLTDFSWLATQGGATDQEFLSIFCPPINTFITYKPDWITIRNDNGVDLLAGMTIRDGETISLFPTDVNTGQALDDDILLTNSFGDQGSIRVRQAAASIIPPGVPITCIVAEDPLGASGVTVPVSNSSSLSGRTSVDFGCTVALAGHGDGYEFILFYRVIVDRGGALSAQGNGQFELYTGVVSGLVININTTLLSGDVVYIYLAALASNLTAVVAKNDVVLAIQNPTTINSEVNSDNVSMLFTEAESGIDDAKAATITCPPQSAVITSFPDWIEIWSPSEYVLAQGGIVYNGDTLLIYPKTTGQGSARDGYIVITNQYGNSVSIYVYQSPAIAPPLDVPVDALMQVWSGDATGLSLADYNAAYSYLLSGNQRLYFACMLAHTLHDETESFNLYWRVFINGVQQGSGSMVVYIGLLETEIVVDTPIFVGDTVVLEFSSITF